MAQCLQPFLEADGHRSFLLGTSGLQDTTCDPGGRGFSAHAGTGGHKGRRCVQSPGLAGEWWTISLPLLAAEDRNCCSRMPAWAWNICKGSKQDWEQRVPLRRQPGAGVRARLTLTYSVACFTLGTSYLQKGKRSFYNKTLSSAPTLPFTSSCSFHLSNQH